MQSRAAVVPLAKGDAVVFAVNARPVRGSRGDYRVTMRHGVSAIRSGRRHTLGIIFHDAARSEEHTSELQSLMRISYAVFCLKKKKPRCARSVAIRTVPSCIPPAMHSRQFEQTVF